MSAPRLPGLHLRQDSGLTTNFDPAALIGACSAETASR
jgi:hypothetical protein